MKPFTFLEIVVLVATARIVDILLVSLSSQQNDTALARQIIPSFLCQMVFILGWNLYSVTHK